MVDLELYQCSIFDELFEKKVITKKIRLIELFSGIGAIEQALLRMEEEHINVFACDNGEIELKMLPDDLLFLIPL